MDTKVVDPLRGALLGGRYRVMGRLARGGTATVYQARDERLERPVAIKIIHPDHAEDAAYNRRLADEARTVARLAHPNIVAIYDQGTHDGSPYLVMEYVRGRSLRDVLRDRRRLDPAESLAILEQILAALAVAHRAGLVHRDVKPENVLVTPPPNGSGDLVDAVVKVADFGLAHAAEATPRDGAPLMATAEYVAPELVSEGRADARSDVYSAGIVLFEMLTGRVPFEGARPAEVAWQHVDRDVPPPSKVVPGLPALVDDVVGRATRRDPAGRPRDAGALLAEVQATRDDVGALAGPTKALAHPTMVVPSIGDARPPWSRLPGQRLGGYDDTDDDDDGPGRVRQLADRAGGWLNRTRSTPRGRQQLIAALAVIVLLLAAGTWWLAIGRYTDAPQLVTLPNTNAVAEANRLGFQITYGPGQYRENVPKDTVIGQDPGPGQRIVRGGVITLTLSLGPERRPVPDVVGQSSDYASELLGQFFTVQLVNGYSDTLPKDYVVSTDPPAGQVMAPRSVVKITVAKGPYPVHVPSVIGTQLADAQNQLQALQFTVAVVHKDDLTTPRDQVLDQTPAGGQGLATANGVTVTLTVSNGPPGTPMPSLLGMGCTDATNLLTSQGYQVQVDGNDFEKQFGKVTAQQPNPNDPVQPGQVVNIQCRIG